MKAYKMTGANESNVTRTRYCFAENYSEAARKFEREFWYINISSVRECPMEEVSINGVNR